jgi:hypothetical protein
MFKLKSSFRESIQTVSKDGSDKSPERFGLVSLPVPARKMTRGGGNKVVEGTPKYHPRPLGS